MDALVGYSGSSDSEGDEDSAEKRKSDHGGTDVDDWDKKSRNFLLESASASSESDESDHGDRRQPYNSGSSGPLGPGSRSQKSGPPATATAPHKLPPPTLHGRSESSVFANPFKAQAEQKLSALQKHVPLTTEAKPSQIGGKRVCLSYRKSGRCRFGIKCKFAHDSDLQTALPPNDSREGRVRSQSPSPSPKEAERDPSEGRPAKRRRPGVADALVPPKKAMKHYNMLRSREQHKTC